MTRLFDTGATRDSSDNKLDFEGFISPRVLRMYAQYMHKCRTRNQPPGQKLRASDNWQKGIPQQEYVKSLVRHVLELWEQNDEGHVDLDVACAIMFNVMGYVFEATRPTAVAVEVAEADPSATPQVAPSLRLLPPPSQESAPAGE